jgi:hypothetical protein
MTIMITGASVQQSARAGTLIGNLRVFNSGVAVPCNFMLCSSATGVFELNSAGNGLVTAAKMLPVGFYAIKIRALGTAAVGTEVGRFQIEVTPPPAPPPPAPPAPPPPPPAPPPPAPPAPPPPAPPPAA